MADINDVLGEVKNLIERAKNLDVLLDLAKDELKEAEKKGFDNGFLEADKKNLDLIQSKNDEINGLKGDIAQVGLQIANLQRQNNDLQSQVADLTAKPGGLGEVLDLVADWFNKGQGGDAQLPAIDLDAIKKAAFDEGKASVIVPDFSQVQAQAFQDGVASVKLPDIEQIKADAIASVQIPDVNAAVELQKAQDQDAIKQAQDAATLLQGDVSRLSAELFAVNSNNDGLLSKITENEIALAEKQAQIDQLTKENVDLDARNTEIEASEADLQAKLDEANAKIAELTAPKPVETPSEPLPEPVVEQPSPQSPPENTAPQTDEPAPAPEETNQDSTDQAEAPSDASEPTGAEASPNQPAEASPVEAEPAIESPDESAPVEEAPVVEQPVIDAPSEPQPVTPA